jgi:hypothetical protein
LAKIRAAKAALEQEARDQAAQGAEDARAKNAAREHRVGRAKGKPATIPDIEHARPDPSAQRNFTDPESRIMKDSATKTFVQAYNVQIAVDATAQVIVACGVTQEATDVRQFVPLMDGVQANVGALPEIVTADAGYFSEGNVEALRPWEVTVFLPPDRRVDGRRNSGPWAQRQSPAAAVMRARLMTTAGAAIYARRKAIVEPVFGQAKEVRGFRRFSLRGYRHAVGEWTIVCLTHNLLKLFRAKRLCPA